jgi:hypothetical protein
VVGEQVEVLEHEADALAHRVGLLRQDALAGEAHVARLRLVQAVHAAQQR